MYAYFYSRNKHVWLWNILQHNRFLSVEKVFLSTMNVSNKLDNAVLRYSKLKSASATLARRKSWSNLNKKTLQDWLRQVNISPLINAKQWLMSSPNICPFVGIGRGKYLSGCSFVWFSALVYCRRKSYLLSTLRIVCHRVKVLSSRLCSIVASLSASCCRFILKTREYFIDNTGCKVEQWTINTFKRRENMSA